MSAGKWKFDESIAGVFDDHVREHVPHYDVIHDLITRMSGWFVESGTNVYDVGTSLGEVIANISTAYPDRIATYKGIDVSPEMLSKASRRFAEKDNVAVELCDVTSDQFSPENASLVVSVLTMMFIPYKDRLDVIRKIYRGLNEGSAFIWVEKVISENSTLNDVCNGLYSDLKLTNGVSKEDIYDKTYSIRGVLKPNTLQANLDILESAGFGSSDVFFKWGNFVGIIAIKQ